MRSDGRANDEMRSLKIELPYLKGHEGSLLISTGDTKVLCVATSESKVPAHRMDIGGWLSAEYNMLPGSTGVRKPRAQIKPDGRSVEISRLIGRSLRQAINLDAIGQRSIAIDCDVVQADAGTRCAAITGAYLALCAHIAFLLKTGQIKLKTIEDIILRPVAAVSLGIVKGQILCDLTYKEDVNADSDCNLVGSSSGQIIEFQCTAEKKPFSNEQFLSLLKIGQAALEKIIAEQEKALFSQCGVIFKRG